MTSKASINVIGFTGKDAELTYTPNGTALCKFSVAVGKKSKSESEEKQASTWYNVTIFGSYAEAMSQHITKGTLVDVEGKLDVDRYVDKNGEKAFSLDITADNILILSNRSTKAEGGNKDSSATTKNKKQAAPANSAKPIQPAPTPDNPRATGKDDEITANQMEAIYSIGRSRNINADVECTKMFNCNIEDLNRKDASALMNHLNSIGGQSTNNRQAAKNSGREVAR